MSPSGGWGLFSSSVAVQGSLSPCLLKGAIGPGEEAWASGHSSQFRTCPTQGLPEVGAASLAPRLLTPESALHRGEPLPGPSPDVAQAGCLSSPAGLGCREQHPPQGLRTGCCLQPGWARCLCSRVHLCLGADLPVRASRSHPCPFCQAV